MPFNQILADILSIVQINSIKRVKSEFCYATEIILVNFIKSRLINLFPIYMTSFEKNPLNDKKLISNSIIGKLLE